MQSNQSVVCILGTLFFWNSQHGVVGGVGIVGGIVYPLFYSAPWLANLYLGYSVAAITMLPVVLLSAWVFRPGIVKIANTAGFTGTQEGESAATADD